MARKLNADVTQVMELEEYDTFVHEKVDFGDFDCLCETAWALKALANNRGFLAEAANRQLRDCLDGKKSPYFTANSIVFVRDEQHTIRANIWAPLSKDPRKSKLEAPSYSYYNCHDHNFHFVTTSYSGPGYVSDLYEYDRSLVRGDNNERIDLRFVETLLFRHGDLMAYRAFNDAHIQQPPEDVSVTLNLVTTVPSIKDKRQYCFDVGTNTIIAGGVENSHERTSKFLEMASHLGDANTIQLLIDLARKYPTDAIRQAAREQLRIMLPEDHDYWLAGIQPVADDIDSGARSYV
jgi:hypothetical protein